MKRLGVVALLMLAAGVQADVTRKLHYVTDTQQTDIPEETITHKQATTLDLSWEFPGMDFTGADAVLFAYAPTNDAWVVSVSGSVVDALSATVLIELSKANLNTNGTFNFEVSVSDGNDELAAAAGTLVLESRVGGDAAALTLYTWSDLALTNIVAGAGIGVTGSGHSRTVSATGLVSEVTFEASNSVLQAAIDAAAADIVTLNTYTSLTATAYGWGDHGAAGYATEADRVAGTNTVTTNLQAYVDAGDLLLLDLAGTRAMTGDSVTLARDVRSRQAGTVGAYGAAFGGLTVAGEYGFAAGLWGIGADGSFVYSDSQAAAFDRSAYTNWFSVRASGGTYFDTPTLTVTGNVSATDGTYTGTLATTAYADQAEQDAKDYADANDADTQLSQEQVDDYVDALINDADSVHTRITVTYDDADDALDLIVDDMNDTLQTAANATSLAVTNIPSFTVRSGSVISGTKFGAGAGESATGTEIFSAGPNAGYFASGNYWSAFGKYSGAYASGDYWDSFGAHNFTSASITNSAAFGRYAGFEASGTNQLHIDVYSTDPSTVGDTAYSTNDMIWGSNGYLTLGGGGGRAESPLAGGTLRGDWEFTGNANLGGNYVSNAVRVYLNSTDYLYTDGTNLLWSNN